MNELYDEEMKNETEICRFKLSSKLNKRAPALIADFDHSRVCSYANKKLKFESFKADVDKDTIGAGAQRTLLAHSGHNLFKGVASKEETHFRNFIGVYDKTTGKMKLYDSVLFRMKPELKSSETDTSSQIPAQKTYWEGINDLTVNFGPKYRKRAMNEHIKYAPDTSVDEVLKLTDLQIESMPEGPMLFAGSKDLGYLPEINRDALTVDQVFNMDEIITPDEQEALTFEAQQFLIADEAKLSNMKSRFGKYINFHLEKAINLDKAKYLIYLNYLIMFHHLKYNDVQKKDPAPDIPQPFRQRMLDTFTQDSKNVQGKISRSIPQLVKDKLVSYILVLALFIDDFVVNCNLLVSDLNNVGLPKFTRIAEAIGCHIKSQKIGTETVKFAELKLPLFVLKPKYVKKTH